MASKKSISAGAEEKKVDVRKAFEQLQTFSTNLASLLIQWKDLDNYYTSIGKSLDDRAKELNITSADNVTLSSPPPVTVDPEPTPTATERPEYEAHPDMKTFCSRMDGLGLRGYIDDHNKELNAVRSELGTAFQFASDPAKLVLDAMTGFYDQSLKDRDQTNLRRSCILLLEELGKVSPKVSPAVKEKAKKLAVEWKGKANKVEEKEPLALLQLAATYGLANEFNVEELLDFVLPLDFALPRARRRHAVDLVKALNVPSSIPNFIEKLINDDKQLDAIKFAYAFELVDKFPPVPLLKAYQKQSKKFAMDIHSKGNHSLWALNESMSKEHAAVKAMIKCIEEHNLESEFPRNVLDKRIEQLEKQKADKKRPSTGPTSAGKKQQQQFGNKRPRTATDTPVGSTVPSITRTNSQPVSSYLDRVPSYLTTSSQYGLVINTPSVAPYVTSGTGPYGFGTNPLGYGGGRSPTRSSLYSSEAQLGLYDRSLGFGGHGMPPSHHSAFYP